MSRTAVRRMVYGSMAGVILGVALVSAWVGYVSYVAARDSTACTAVPAARDDPAAGQRARQQELERLLEEMSERAGGAGLQATVITGDGETWRAAAGDANRANGCPLTPEHQMGIASLTKMYTAALVMDQVEKGALSLDDRLDRWLDLPYGDRVTVRMLLNHTSGIPNFTHTAADLWFRARYLGLPGKSWEPAALVRVVGSRQPVGEAGLAYAYSGSNYILLGAILEEVTGKPYSTLLGEMADRLGLLETDYAPGASGRALADGYDRTALNPAPSVLGPVNVSGLRQSMATGSYAAAGIRATSEDVARFVDGLFGGQVVSESSLALMMDWVEAPEPRLVEQVGYGLGISRLRAGGEELVGHWGFMPGYTALAVHSFEEGWTVVVLANESVVESVLGAGQIVKWLTGRQADW